MARNPVPMPPVGLLSDLAAVDHPQYMPSSPHRLPPPGERPSKRTVDGLIYGPGVGAPSVMGGGPPNLVGVRDYEPHRYATVVEQNIPVSLAPTGVPFLTEPSSKRNLLGLRNPAASAGTVYIGFGRDASTASWLALVPGQTILFDTVVPQDDLYCIADGVATLSFAFSTFSPEA